MPLQRNTKTSKGTLAWMRRRLLKRIDHLGVGKEEDKEIRADDYINCKQRFLGYGWPLNAV
jgi:hypothetical protein